MESECFATLYNKQKQYGTIRFIQEEKESG